MRKTDINRYTNASSRNDNSSPNIKSGIGVFLKLLLTIFFILAISFTIIGSAVVVYMSQSSNSSINLDLRSLKIDLTSFIYVNDEDDNPVQYQAVYAGESRVWVDYDNIPTAMKNAMVAIEDKRFYEHNGVDWIRTGGAIASFFTGSDTYGGSTLTQQLIKNLTQKAEVSITRKISEIINALTFEQKYTKDEILETYLNIVNFGSGCNGVQSAANKYFNKNISECSIAECACIAGITQNPSQYTPLVYPDENRKRQQTVLDEMLNQSMITQDEYNQAITESENMNFVDEDETSVSSTTQVNNWYIESMLQEIASDLAASLQVDKDTATYMLMHNGFKIHSAMDVNAQQIAEATVQNASIMPKNQSIQVGYVMVDYDGRILAVIGQRGTKTANLLWNCATVATRQPGSSFKPLAVYAPALEYKLYNYSSIIPDSPLKNIPGTSGSWPPNWYKYYKGQMTLQYAIEISANAPAAQVVNKLTPLESFKFVSQKLGFTTLNEAEDCTYSGMATGGSYNGVTVKEMAAAFQIFGNGGVYNKPYSYYYVEDSSGKIVLDNRNNTGTQAITSENSTIMRKLLQKVVTGAEGTGTLGNIPGVTTFAKTGTTDDNENSWFVGGTPYAVAGIWTGYDIPTVMSDAESKYAAIIWKSIMSQYITNLPNAKFTDDSKVITAKYCTSTGLLATNGCSSTAVGYYSSDNMPSYCTTHKGYTSYSSASSKTSSFASDVSSQISSVLSSQVSSQFSSSQTSSAEPQSSQVSSQNVSSQVTSSSNPSSE